MLTAEDKRILLNLARAAVSAAAHNREFDHLPPDLPPVLLEPRGAFVTLMQGRRLRGCIGLVEAVLPLAETVMKMAVSAAVYDPRFPVLAPEELDRVRIEISVMSALERVSSPEAIVLGRHGIMVKRGRENGVFLPQVAEETGWDRARFLSELCAGKAGLPAEAWKDPRTELHVFTVEKFEED